MKRLLFYWGPVTVWMAVIFLLSERQRITIADKQALNFLIFKFFHLVEYAMLYFLMLRAVRGGRYRPAGSQAALFIVSFGLTLLYAVSDEVHQTFVPTREGKFRDVIIDGAGALISWYILEQQLPKAPKKLKSWARRLQLI